MQPRITSTALPSWDEVHLFLAALRGRSLTAAARSLGVDQSTASRRLAALERHLGVRLFDRVPGGLEPTAAAEAVVPAAEAAEAQVLAFSRGLAGADAAPEGTVRVALPEAMDAELLVPALPRFRRQWPQVQLQVVASSALANLARREADLAVRLLRPQAGELTVKKVGTLHTGVYGTAAQVRRGLAGADWVGWDEGQGEPRELAWMARHVSEAQLRLRCNRMEGKLAAATAGLGLAILSRALASRRPALKPLELPEPTPSYEVWLVGHARLVQVPRVRAVWNFLEELLAGAARTAGG